MARGPSSWAALACKAPLSNDRSTHRGGRDGALALALALCHVVASPSFFKVRLVAECDGQQAHELRTITRTGQRPGRELLSASAGEMDKRRTVGRRRGQAVHTCGAPPQSQSGLCTQPLTSNPAPMKSETTWRSETPQGRCGRAMSCRACVVARRLSGHVHTGPLSARSSTITDATCNTPKCVQLRVSDRHWQATTC